MICDLFSVKTFCGGNIYPDRNFAAAKFKIPKSSPEIMTAHGFKQSKQTLNHLVKSRIFIFKTFLLFREQQFVLTLNVRNFDILPDNTENMKAFSLPCRPVTLRVGSVLSGRTVILFGIMCLLRVSPPYNILTRPNQGGWTLASCYDKQQTITDRI